MTAEFRRRLSAARMKISLVRYGTDYARVKEAYPETQDMKDFFGEEKFQRRELPNFQEFDLDGLAGRLRSSSYAPRESQRLRADDGGTSRTFRCQSKDWPRPHGLRDTNVFWPAACEQEVSMKIVYNWLRIRRLSVTPQDLASRLALSGTNIASVEGQPLGGVIDAEVTSNRPDCLGVYGIAREVGAIFKLPVKFLLPKPVESSA